MFQSFIQLSSGKVTSAERKNVLLKGLHFTINLIKYMNIIPNKGMMKI